MTTYICARIWDELIFAVDRLNRCSVGSAMQLKIFNVQNNI